jgi:hypothetical protein
LDVAVSDEELRQSEFQWESAAVDLEAQVIG